jgi:hypothetical protein
MSVLRDAIERRGADTAALAEKVIRDPALLPELVEGLAADTARVKFGCAKILRLLSERQPELLYPHFDFFVGLLDHKNKILQWEAITILADLARVDTEDKFSAIFSKYFAPVPGPVMITAANVIGGAARIALARPHWADRIAREILKVARAQYQTPECRNVAIGHALNALAEFLHLLRDLGPVLRFVRRQVKNTRPATRQKAERLLKTQAGPGRVAPTPRV